MSMHTWFECKIRYEKLMENGMNKKVTEPYLVDALSFTEAEARIIEEMTPFITGEFTVSDIKRANYSELFPSEEEAAIRSVLLLKQQLWMYIRIVLSLMINRKYNIRSEMNTIHHRVHGGHRVLISCLLRCLRERYSLCSLCTPW